MSVDVTKSGRERASELAREWRGILCEQARSSLPAFMFCELRGVPLRKFYSWKHRLKDSLAAEEEGDDAAGDGGRGATPGGEAGAGGDGVAEVFARVVVGATSAPPAGAGSGGGAQIVLPGGALVRLEPGVDRGLLRAILEELRRPC